MKVLKINLDRQIYVIFNGNKPADIVSISAGERERERERERCHMCVLTESPLQTSLNHSEV